jgi:DNA-binding protein YbaB
VLPLYSNEPVQKCHYSSDPGLQESILRGFERVNSLETMEVEGRATQPDGSGVTVILQGSGKLLSVKVDKNVAGNVEETGKLFVAACQTARQKIAQRIGSFLEGGSN